jgi:hypothetical protein
VNIAYTGVWMLRVAPSRYSRKLRIRNEAKVVRTVRAGVDEAPR